MSFNYDKGNIDHMKRSLTLDFNKVKTLNVSINSVLSSPDLNLLKVDTPELENMILDNPSVNTPTPSFFTKPVTMEQASFAGGFEEALNKLHNSNGSDSNASTIYNESSTFLPTVKEEPQTVPNITNSPPVSPVDLEYQERLKLERKRQRNRLAASKCRSRKLERISKLEDKVKQLKGENNELASLLAHLKETVGLLKLEVMEHANAGCPIMVSPF